jgi:hypothetical protein
MKAVIEPDFEAKVKTRSKTSQEAQEEEEDDDHSTEEDESAAAGGTSRLSRKARWERHGMQRPYLTVIIYAISMSAIDNMHLRTWGANCNLTAFKFLSMQIL